MVTRVIKAPDEDGSCPPCPGTELDEELLARARESVHTTYNCGIDHVEIVELQRVCLSTPEQTGGYCSYWARFWYRCQP